MLEVIRAQEMGDLKSGFEEVDGVRLGYLVIKGKQMFALSQVFTDLLKNIPRTTVHKRMDHLKVKKHHCGLEELRKLKAINSVAFHAAKCTLISREDVDALYTSCKTERVLKSKRRGAGGRLCLQPALGLRGPAEPCSRFWTQSGNIWLGLNEAPQSLPIKRSAPDRAGGSLLPPAPHLPRFLCKYGGRLYPEVARPPCKGLLKYAPVGIGSSYVAFHPEPPFFRGKALTAASQPKLCRPAGFPRRHRRRPGEDRRGCARGLLLLPPPKPHALRAPPLDLGRLHVLKQGCCLPDTTCSSESESSSFSDHAGHDSDVGSSLSSSSNSASSSSGEEEEEESASDSSDEESSSDSSSASSQASVESIRFRRTSFSCLAGKAPLIGPANPLYHFSGGPGHGRAEGLLGAHCDFKAESPGPAHGGCPPRTGTFLADNDRGPRISPPHATLPNAVWGSDLTAKRVTEGDSSPHPKKTALKQLEHLGEAKQCPQTAFTHCADSKAALSRLLKGDPACTSPPTNGSKIASFKLSPKSHHSQTPPAPEAATANSHPDTLLVHSVKIKVEDISEYEGYAACQSTTQALKHERNVTNEECHSSASEHNTPETASDGKGAPARSERETPSPHTRATSQAAPCALGLSNTDDGEYKFGARIRQNYRKLVLGKRPVLLASPNKPNLKSDRGAHFPAKDEECEETMDDFSVCSKRKRAAINLSAVTKRPFHFMANFPCPPSLIIGSDGDLLPAYSLNTTRDSHTPHRVHPVWKWQLGCSPVPLPPSHKFRKL
ncbi:SKI/DACH domain-containing protein 1 [Ambystoma mexicanum]|uniref:SKI/DACH domain-containing protein 1 n=1 Tax=Ambystoma mexicanum TaxID=8296 RepID=UPI0037E881A6